VSREVKVFLDDRRIKDEENFKAAFAKSVLSSTVVIPFVSVDAMERMIADQRCVREDSVLIEWILALEGLNDDKSNVKRIYPVFIGRRDKMSGSITNISTVPYFGASGFDRRNVFECLPDKPSDPLLVASVNRAREMLVTNGVAPSSKLDQMTVKNIVESLKDHIGIFLHDLHTQKEETFAKEICNRVNDILRTTVNNESNSSEEVN
jgi:hypothetical protein